MDVRLFLRLALCSGLLLSACGEEDPGPQRPPSGPIDDDRDSDERSTGSTRDGGRDAGRGGSRDDEDEDEVSDEEERGDETPDAGPRRPTTGGDAGARTDGSTTSPRDSGNTDGDGQMAGEDPGGNEPPPESEPPEMDEIAARCASIEMEASELVWESCASSCHAPGSHPVTLESTDAIAMHAERIADRVQNAERPMPPQSRGGLLPPAQRESIVQWMECLRQ